MKMEKSVDKLLCRARANILQLQPYNWAHQAEDEMESVAKIFLNANEFPDRPFAIDKIGFKLNRYPKRSAKKLKDTLASLYNVSPEQLLITRGSNESIDLFIRAFCEPKDDSILICNPTYAMYAVCANIQGANIIDVPLNLHNLQLDMDSLLRLKDDSSIKLIFIANPAAHMGHSFREKDLIDLCELFKENALIIIDEAYIEFSQLKSLSIKLDLFSNLVILRTLSKAHGMAGLRVGISLAHPKLIRLIANISPPYLQTTLSIELAYLGLSKENLDYRREIIKEIIAERERLRVKFASFSFIKRILPSVTNFLFLEMESTLVKELFLYAKAENIYIRPLETAQIIGVRITVGSKEENDRLLSLMRRFC